MLKSILSFSLLLTCFVSQAAFLAFVYKVEVTCTQGVFNGYFLDTHNAHVLSTFDSLITSKGSKYLIKSSRPSNNGVHIYASAEKDTLDLYLDMYRIDSLDADIFFKDKLLRIPEKDIKSIKEISIVETSAYQSTFVTSNSKDKAWLTQGYLNKEVIIYNFNEWVTIYYFYDEKGKGKLSSEFERLLAKHNGREFTDEDQAYWNNKADQYIKNLESKKVIMIRAWSD